MYHTCSVPSERISTMQGKFLQMVLPLDMVNTLGLYYYYYRSHTHLSCCFLAALVCLCMVCSKLATKVVTVDFSEEWLRGSPVGICY